MPAPNPSEHQLRVLIIDNFDSYTFNLFQFCASYSPVVLRNNQFTSQHFLENILPCFDAVIISPGPGRPECETDVGVCNDVLKDATIPILGVCLGHQSLGFVNGCKIIGADPPMHGRLSAVHHSGKGIFTDIPSPFRAVRYHSLIVSNQNVSDELETVAWCGDKDTEGEIIMGFAHRTKPIWSVQFHPEVNFKLMKSICTEHGQQIIANFIGLAKDYWNTAGQTERLILNTSIPESIRTLSVVPQSLFTKSVPAKQFKVMVKELSGFTDPELIFKNFFSKRYNPYWLDSARVCALL
jgi:para-aminobenzoate synthetase